MVERSRFWDGTTTGDAVSITNAEFMDRFWRAILGSTANRGVLANWLNELEVTDGGGLNAQVDTGGAIDYGLFYENDAALNVALPNNATVEVIIRRTWAAQTARAQHDGGGGLVQNPGVTYDIPLATVTTLAGVINNIVDTREFLYFSTIMLEGAVQSDSIATDAVTPAILTDQTRWLSRGYGELEADVTNPATFISGFFALDDPELYFQASRPYWAFADAASEACWLTFQVPVDISSATMNVYFWTGRPDRNYHYATEMRWEFSSYDAAAAAVLVNQVGAATVSYPYARVTLPGTGGGPYYHVKYPWRDASRDLIGTITVNASDIVHMQVFRNGAHGADTYPHDGALFMVEIEYTADS